jgi:hypothetical protein
MLIDTLEDCGLLLQTDPRLPNVAGLVAGEPVKGSWWAHPKSHEIFREASKLAAHRDVLVCKLVSRKTTFVHRRLWPALLGVACAREHWQLDDLSRAARALLAQVDELGRLEATGDAARALENLLLVHSEQVHTDAGSHAKVLESWAAWARRARAGKPLAPPKGKERIEQIVSELKRRFGGEGELPWLARRLKIHRRGAETAEVRREGP